MQQTQNLSMQQVLAPQLQQSLVILQAPMLELRNIVQQELQTNPVLEEEVPEASAGRSEPAERRLQGRVRAAGQTRRGVARVHGAEQRLQQPQRRRGGASAIFLRFHRQPGNAPAASDRADQRRGTQPFGPAPRRINHRQHRRQRLSPDHARGDERQHRRIRRGFAPAGRGDPEFPSARRRRAGPARLPVDPTSPRRQGEHAGVSDHQQVPRRVG